MIKTIIFDLDGVLVDTKKIHFNALNLALNEVGSDDISFSDHVKIYDGLPTAKKLAILIKRKKIKKSQIDKIKKKLKIRIPIFYLKISLMIVIFFIFLRN